MMRVVGHGSVGRGFSHDGTRLAGEPMTERSEPRRRKLQTVLLSRAAVKHLAVNQENRQGFSRPIMMESTCEALD